MTKNFLIYFLLIFLFCTNLNLFAQQKISPFSKIEITSNRATGYKDKQIKDIFYFNYLDNVLIKFADGSSAKCEELKIKINTKKKQNLIDNKQENNLGPIEEIALSKNILIIQNNKSIKADYAHIYPQTKICELSGNIEIEQVKENTKDLPINTKCHKARLNLATQEISVHGNEIAPVSTTIDLQNYTGLTNSNKKEK